MEVLIFCHHQTLPCVAHDQCGTFLLAKNDSVYSSGITMYYPRYHRWSHRLYRRQFFNPPGNRAFIEPEALYDRILSGPNGYIHDSAFLLPLSRCIFRNINLWIYRNHSLKEQFRSSRHPACSLATKAFVQQNEGLLSQRCFAVGLISPDLLYGFRLSPIMLYGFPFIDTIAVA